jgi:serine phosphatase RsbU (regulator of sigma subunit)
MSWHACNCGHPVPLVFARNGVARLNFLSTHGTLPLGFFNDPRRYTEKHQIRWNCEPGDTLFLFTDGLFEARDNTGEQLGIENLTQIVTEKFTGSDTLPVPQEIIDEVAARGFDCNADDCCAIFVQT